MQSDFIPPDPKPFLQPTQTTGVPKDSFTSQMPALSVSWLVAGGLLYTGGVPFFMLADYRQGFKLCQGFKSFVAEC